MRTSTSNTQPDSRRWWALTLLCGAFFMVILDAGLMTVALPSIEEELGFSAQGLQWVVSAYALTFAGLLLLGGRAADLLERRRSARAGHEGDGALDAPATELQWRVRRGHAMTSPMSGRRASLVTEDAAQPELWAEHLP